MSWRRYSEAMLQLGPVNSFTGRQFRATSHARCEATFKEASEVAQSIRVIEKDLKSLLKNIEVHFKNLRCILVSPLPRIYDEGPMGVQPLDEEARLLGANMEVEAIPRAAEDARRRIQAEVLAPLNEWMNIYKQIMERMKVLEALRLELDSRRRTVLNLQGKVERVRSTLGTTRDKGRAELEETESTLARKQDKMEGTGQKYMALERTVYNSLYTLVRDTAVLRDYTHCCLNIIMEAFQSAAKAYDTPPSAQGAAGNPAAAGATGATYPPENKYEAQLPAADRPTPKGISGLFDRLRGKASKAPPSPASMRDAPDHHHDQAPFAAYAVPYGGHNMQHMPSGYGTQNGSSMRPTHESDIPPPSAYIQQAGGQHVMGNYSPPYGQPQLSAAPSHHYGPAQLTGGHSNYGMQQQQLPQRTYPNAHHGGHDVNAGMRMHPGSAADAQVQGGGGAQYGRHAQQQQQQPAGMVSATGWTQDGY